MGEKVKVAEKIRPTKTSKLPVSTYFWKFVSLKLSTELVS